MQGLRVLDLSESRTGAYAARMLACLGAEVVVGEPAGGSPLRGEPLTWAYLGACKSVRLVEPGDEIEAADGFDTVVLATDGPAEPVAELAGSLRRAHPHLIVAAVTPFGLTGPANGWRAGPLELWAIGGHLALTGDPDRQPIPGGGPWESHLVGANAAVAVQAAAVRAVDHGLGALVDVGALETLAGSHQWSISLHTHEGVVKRRAGNRLGEMHHPICLYPCRDGWVCIAAASFHQWEGLCIAMDRVELLADDDLANAAVRFDRADELDEIITAWTGGLTVAEVVEASQANFCPAGPVAELPQVVDHPQLRHRRFWTPVPHLGPEAVMPSAPFPLHRPSGERPPVAQAPELPTDGDLRGGGRPSPTAPSLPHGPTSPSTGDGERFRPLAGVRVIELTISWAGPMAGRFLADLGAEVIKVEHPTSRGVAVTPPDPDAERPPWSWGDLPPAEVRNGVYPGADPGIEWWNRMSLWNKMNRSKRSLCLDVKAPGGREVFERLVATADIVLNNYSPRGVRSLGIDRDSLRAIKPDIVTVAMSGFGSTGPGAEAVSWGPILDAASGLAATTGYADSGPYKQGVAYPDPIGGTHGALAILAAWWEHRRTGRAVDVDLSQLETLLSVVGDQVLEASITGTAPPRRGARSATSAPAGVYRCAGDDRWLALTVYDGEDWDRLVAVVPGLDRAAWAELDARRRDHDAIDAAIEAWTVDRGPDEAMATLQAAGLAAARVSTNRDLVEDPQLEARGFIVTVDHPATGPQRFPGSPFLVDGQPLAIHPVSSLGADNDELLAELGFGAAERAQLTGVGTIATAPPT
jgi:crotonobetainyl-CoA:carnitine CoA-transferase CaiB-like acyl-CoA transferase